jgi:hypothetical protein
MRSGPNAPLAIKAQPGDRRVERMAVTDDERNLGAARGLDDGCAVGKRERDRLLDQQMLAGLCGKHGMARWYWCGVAT